MYARGMSCSILDRQITWSFCGSPTEPCEEARDLLLPWDRAESSSDSDVSVMVCDSRLREDTLFAFITTGKGNETVLAADIFDMGVVGLWVEMIGLCGSV